MPVLNGPSSLLGSLISAVSDGWIIQYSIVATSTLTVCEYIATLQDEIRLIWPSRFSIAKILFNANRYVPYISCTLLTYFMPGNRDELICRRGFFAAGVFTTLQYVVAEAILFIRAYAIWGRDRIIGSILALTLLASTVLAFVFVIAFLKQVIVAPVSALPNGCSLLFESKIVWVCLMILLICETLTLSVILTRVTRQATRGVSPMLMVMLRDGVYYYVAVLVVTIVNLFIIFFTRASLRNFLLPAQGVLHSIFCNRLLLRTRGAYESLLQQSISFVTFGQKEVITSTSTTTGSGNAGDGRLWIAPITQDQNQRAEEIELELR